MRTTIVLTLVCITSGGRILAQDKSTDLFVWPVTAKTNAESDYVTLRKPTPTRSIVPEDIEEGSIKMLRMSTNGFVVRFTYTDAGAKKMLDFRREHLGGDVVIRVGSYECRARLFDGRMEGWTEAGYLKHRGDKFHVVSEDDAKKIIEGLTKK